MRGELGVVAAVAVGSALGGVARYLANAAFTRALGEGFPWGILAVNVAGSFLIGLVAVLTDPQGRALAGEVARQFWMAGVLGGFTTFSSFSLNTLQLAQDGDWGRALANVALSVGLCLGGAALGAALGAGLNR